MKILFTVITLFTSITFCNGQTLVWNGNHNTDFFDERNWEDKATGNPIPFPANNAAPENILKWDTDINRNLEISNATSIISSYNNNGIIKMGSGILAVTNSTIKIKALSNGNVNLEEEGYIEVLDNTTPLETGLIIDIKSGLSWVKVINLKPEVISTNHLTKFKVNNTVSVYKTNVRLDNYYGNGTIIRSNLSTNTPVTFYDKPNLTGTSVSLTVDAIHSGSSITNLDNKIESFVLKRGFMLTIADDEAGTGKSKNYIASETDLTINKLPTHLLNNISFVRVVPWNWVTKKGVAFNNTGINDVGGTATTLGNSWFYRWSNTHDSTLDGEYAPMSWGAGGADDDADIIKYKQEYKATHVLSFNECDHCTGQSGQYRNLCQEDVALGYHRNLMKTGLRIVSPSGREDAPFGWLKDFYDKATAQDIRIDVIGVHWYDWGSNPENNTNHSATTIFNRFKQYLKDVHDEYGLPIWITEFNANPNRSTATNYAFMQLALPYLETLDYVERYAWFEPVSNVADYYDASNNLTNIGTYFQNFTSSKSIPENTISTNNNIDKNHKNNLTLNHNIATNGNFITGDLKAWLGTNNQVVIDTDNPSTNLDISKNESVANINNNVGSLYQILEVAPNVRYTVTFDYKWVGSGGTNLTARIYRDLNSTNTIGSKTLNTTPDVWYTKSINFTAPANVFKARLFFNKTAGNQPLRITNVKVRLNPHKIWDGSAGTNWNTAVNWVQNAVPNTTDIVFIPRNLENYPIVSADITLGQLVIDSGASFITSGTVTGGVTYYADLPDNKWHLISPPVSGQVMNNNWVAAAGIAAGQGNNIAIGAYQNGALNSSTGPWQYFSGTTTSFSNGTGYAMQKLSEGMFIFNGSLPSGTQNIPITQGSNSSWNLIGNPFPSYIDVAAFLTANATPLKNAFEAIYVWNVDTDSYTALTSSYIAPGQAFFVNSDAASTTISVTEAMLSHQENVQFYKNSSTPKIAITVDISNNSITKTTEIEFLENKTKGLDPRFDIGLFDGVNSDFSIYTHLLENNQGVKFQKQTLPNIDFETTVIPLGVKAEAGKEITISTKTLNLPEGLNIFIEDRVLNTFTKLNETNANYKVTLNETLNDVGRFYIHTSSKNVLNTNDVLLQNITIYKVNAETLRISGLKENNTTKLKIYNLLGKEVLSTDFKNERTKDINISKFSTGVYIVQMKNKQGTFNKKIIVD
ncbi:MAG: glycosyl hydrolase [Polaribacter sp.]